MQVYDQTEDDPQGDDTAVLWLFIGAAAIGIIEQIIKFLIK